MVMVALLLTLLIPQADTAPRNVVLLIADDLGLQLGCYGDKAARTPNLDALAAKGVRFTHAFTPVASCSPSRAAMYSGQFTHTIGQYGLNHGTHNFFTRPNAQTLPIVLKKAGIPAAVVAKFHVGPAATYPFEVIGANGRDVQAMAKKAEEFITANKEKGFFLSMGYTDPHRAGKGFANEKAWPGVKPVKFDPKEMPIPDHLPDTPEVRADLADFYESINRLDQGVGMMLEVLKRTGTDKNTLVIFVSDNGMPFPGAKTTLYDAGIRMPMIVYDPQAKKTGHVNAAMVSFVDLAPTALDYLGVKAKTKFTGRSFLPILEEENPKGWDEIYASHTFHEITMYYPMRAVRTRDFKYIRNFAHALEFPAAADLYESKTWQAILKQNLTQMGKIDLKSYLNRPAEELYDLQKDPSETRNVAADPAYTKTLAELREKLKNWQQETADPWVLKYKRE
jgi:N-sulfoglucosamine sulfohydrolase